MRLDTCNSKTYICQLTVRIQTAGTAGVDLEQRQHDATRSVAPTGVVEGKSIVNCHHAGSLRVALQQRLYRVVRCPAQTGHVQR